MPEEIAPVIELAPALGTPVPTPESTAPPAPPSPPVAEQPAPAGVEQTATPPTPAVPPPVTPPAVAPEVQQYIARLEEQNERARTQEDQQVIRDFVATRALALENEQGFTPEQAKFVAEREGQHALRLYQGEQFRQGQINAAFAIGQQYGVDPRELMNLPTPEAMHQAARLATAFTKTQTDMAALKAENEALKKKLVPPTTYASPGVSPTPAPGSYIEKLKSGGPLPSAAEIDKFTARYLTGSA